MRIKALVFLYLHYKEVLNMEVEIKQKLEVTESDIDDIVTTAFEGGINYWCKKVEVVGDYLGEYASDQISRNGKLKIYLHEDVDGETMYLLSQSKLLAGIKMYLENIHPYDITYRNGTEIELDTCQVDAEVADMIIQYALFKEVVFG